MKKNANKLVFLIEVMAFAACMPYHAKKSEIHNPSLNKNSDIAIKSRIKVWNQMSSTLHSQPRSKHSSKHRRKENELQSLYRQNKSAFPADMIERDILHTLEVNKVTQKNIGNFLDKLHSGELRREIAWESVSSKKKNKDIKLSTNGRRHNFSDRMVKDDRDRRGRNRDKGNSKGFVQKIGGSHGCNSKSSNLARRSGKKFETGGGSLSFAHLVSKSGVLRDQSSRFTLTPSILFSM